ncbi:MAG: ATP-binding cassette domain-containing protein [Verrucomicrobiales bacterium]|nr:ATP-binding cassette domain-containing protein [Verrucomicrobiales bacterium]
MPENLVSIEAVSKTFPGAQVPALNNISGVIRAGEIYGLVGADGAGKTTLLRLMAGLLVPDAGRITVTGLDSVTKSDLIHERIGYMPQRFGLYEDLSVQENLRLYADLRGVTGEARAETFGRLLRFTGLAPFTKRRAGALSGGMKQKLGLACALIRKPQLLLLDEPSVGVDPLSRRELWKMVGDLVDDGIGVVWSTAYLDEAERCDTVLLLNEGELLHDGSPGELTGRVEGRVYLISGIAEEDRRGVLAGCLKHEAVMDGVIQGKKLRLLVEEGKNLPDLPGEADLAVPRFEDAFIDILGGTEGGNPALTADMKSVRISDDGPVIEAKGLTKKFGSFTAADNITFEVGRGEVFGLLGPNGAGKSTAFKMMCGLLQPTAGRARVAGLDLKTATSKARSRIGYMAQKFSLYGELSVQQNLEFFAGIYGLTGRERRAATERMIDIFDLEGYASTSAILLPPGFKQRLALASSLMHEPAVLFLDEPTSGVDPLTRREFWNHINSLVERGVTIMVTTHFMDEAEYCDRIALIFRGQVVATGSPDELKSASGAPDASLEEAFIELIERESGEEPV